MSESCNNWLEFKEKGNKEFQLGNYNEAVKFYTKSIEKNSDKDILYSNRALCFIQLKQLDKAESDLNTAIKINPFNIKAFKRLGNIHILKGKLKEAELYYNKCKELAIDDESNIKDSNFLTQLINKDKANKQAFQNNDYEKVLLLSEELLISCEDYYDLKLKYVESLIRLRKLQESIKFLDNKFSNNEKLREDNVYLTALALYYDGMYEKCKSLLNTLISTTKSDKSKNKYETLLSKISLIDISKSIANKAFINGDYDLAVEKYLLILNVDSTNYNLLATIYSNIALCKHKRHKLSDALHYINLAIEKNPLYLKAYFRRGLINKELSLFEQSEQDFKKVLDLDPSYIEAKSKLDEIETEKEKKKSKDYYKILDICATANEKEITKAYKQLAAKYHPDKNSQDKKQLEEASKKFEEVREAYEVLGCKQKRFIYDSGREVNDFSAEFGYTDDFYNESNYGKHTRKNNNFKNEGFEYDYDVTNKRAQDIYYKKNKDKDHLEKEYSKQKYK